MHLYDIKCCMPQWLARPSQKLTAKNKTTQIRVLHDKADMQAHISISCGGCYVLCIVPSSRLSGEARQAAHSHMSPEQNQQPALDASNSALEQET